jgi:hypothetical protein
MTMATPTTIKMDNKPAPTKPKAHRQTRKAQWRRGASGSSSWSDEDDDDFFDMDVAEDTADRIIKTAGQKAEFACCALQLNWQRL